MRTLIVDDEPSARQTMTAMIDTYCPELEKVGEAGSVAEAQQLVDNLQPELVLLDIKIGNETGFDLLKRLEQRNFAVIFTTAYDHFALTAIKFSATDYLLKPISPDELVAAVEKAQVAHSQPNDRMQVLMEYMNGESGQGKNIVLPIAGGFQLAEISTITYIQADRNYSVFHFEDGTRLIASKNLKEFDDLLGRFGLMRVHQSHLINVRHLKSFKSSGRAGFVEMKNGTQLKVASSKKNEVVEFFKRQQI